MQKKDNSGIINKINYLAKNKIPFLIIIDFEKKNPILLKLNDIDNTQIKYSFNGNKNYIENKKNIPKPELTIVKPSFEEYKKAFKIVKQNINHGNSYLTNLTVQSVIKTNLTLEEIFFVSKAKYKLWLKDKFTFFSPEIFIQIKEQKIFSYPMKGTIDANLSDAKNKLLNDEKETAEHFTIVDLIRNDLNIVAKKVSVDKFKYIEKIVSTNKNLLQMSSQISGQLDVNYREKLGNIIFELLPAGSISGAPKKKTIEIIREAENYKRGFYTGVAGIFDGENFDSCVMIRFIENNNGNFLYKSGGGITSKSKLEPEYQEIIDKIYIPISNTELDYNSL